MIRPGTKYEHIDHGLVEVKRVEDDMVVFKRPGGTDKFGYINNRQESRGVFSTKAVPVGGYNPRIGRKVA